MELTSAQKKEIETLRKYCKSYDVKFRFNNHKMILSPDGTYIDFGIVIKVIRIENNRKMYLYVDALSGKWDNGVEDFNKMIDNTYKKIQLLINKGIITKKIIFQKS